MNSSLLTFDPIWEETIYGQGQHLNRYPFDIAVSFVYRYYPRCKDRKDVRILEVGCGAGNNLWFAAREGFQVAGIDGSAKAIEYARKRFAEEGLTGDFRLGDFTELPFATDSFDLVIDRCAITCCGLSAAQKATAEAHRVLAENGKFLCNPYSDRHSSAHHGCKGSDGLTLDITGGSLAGVGQICFYSRSQIGNLFANNWELISLQHCESVEAHASSPLTHAEWRLIASKVTLE